MKQENTAKLPLLGSNEAVLMEHITANLHDPDNDIYLNPPCPVTAEEMENLLRRQPAFPLFSMDYHTIRVLGTDINAKRQTNTDGNLPVEHIQAARLLASVQRPFSLCYSCSETKQINFCMGFPRDCDGNFVNSLLSASFGFADRIKAAQPERHRCVWSAACVPTQCSAEELDRHIAPCQPGRWADAVAAAIIGTDCTLEVSFCPIDAAWAREQLADCLETSRKLSAYLKHRPQVSVNSGQTNVSAENANKILSFIQKKTVNISTNAAMSLNLSEDYTAYNTEAELFEARLRHRIRLLQQARDSGWMVRLEISSPNENDPDAEVLRASLGAALLPIGFSCVWNMIESGSPTLAGAVLPSGLVPALISFPSKPFVGLTLCGRSHLELNPPYHTDAETDSIPIGSILWNSADTGQTLRIPRREMNRHTIIFGMTGGGKTNTVCSMLSELKNLHYLVIEPVKSEYRSLPGIHRLTMIAGSPDSLMLNPFWFPPGARLQYHIDSLKLIISSAFDLYAAMPNILEQCLYRVYSNCGWNIVSGENIYRNELPEEDLFPTFRTLCDEVECYLNDTFGESEIGSNYRGALLARLQSFTSGSKGLLLNTSSHIDFERWIQENVVVELDALADDADKAIVMGALLVQYFQFIKYQMEDGAQSGILKHLFVLEEAHHLFRETKAQTEDGSSASSQLVSMLNNLLAEIRAYGEGFIIVDQSPSSISTSVLKNTAVKIVHRVDYGEDIRLLQSALLLEAGDYVTASLAQGEALIRFGIMQSPAAVRIPPYSPKDTQKAHPASDINAADGINDRIRDNKPLMEHLHESATQFMNLMLFESCLQKIQEAFSAFQSSVERWISYYCGWSGSAPLTKQTYLDLLDLSVSYAVARNYDGQYCLQRMIRMFVLRTAVLSGDDLTEKAWDVLKDYRHTRIYDYLSFYYQNHNDIGIRMIAETLTPLPETGILKQITDVLWSIPLNDTQQIDEAFESAMQHLFYLPLSEDMRIRFKLLVLKYREKAAEL